VGVAQHAGECGFGFYVFGMEGPAAELSQDGGRETESLACSAARICNRAPVILVLR